LQFSALYQEILTQVEEVTQVVTEVVTVLLNSTANSSQQIKVRNTIAHFHVKSKP
jgi:hypothetical protein